MLVTLLNMHKLKRCGTSDIITSLRAHKNEQKPPNSMSINSSMRVYNLEYVFSNLFITLIYNDLIFAHLFCYSPAAEAWHMFFTKPDDISDIFLFLQLWNGKKCSETSEHFDYYLLMNNIKIYTNTMLGDIKMELVY